MENPNVLRFTGFADIYDQYRAKPPEIIADLLLQLAEMDRADHVGRHYPWSTNTRCAERSRPLLNRSPCHSPL